MKYNMFCYRMQPRQRRVCRLLDKLKKPVIMLRVNNNAPTTVDAGLGGIPARSRVESSGGVRRAEYLHANIP